MTSGEAPGGLGSRAGAANGRLGPEMPLNRRSKLQNAIWSSISSLCIRARRLGPGFGVPEDVMSSMLMARCANGALSSLVGVYTSLGCGTCKLDDLWTTFSEISH